MKLTYPSTHYKIQYCNCDQCRQHYEEHKRDVERENTFATIVMWGIGITMVTILVLIFVFGGSSN